MRRRAWLLAGLLLLGGPGARAQEATIASLQAPAERVLRFRSDLRLDSIQVRKLGELAKLQVAALTKATSAFLRAEADLLDAMRSDDLAIRRTALEKRARMAIDAEMIRLRAEKDTRAVLTEMQADLAPILFMEMQERRERTHPLWESQVAPLPLNASPFVVPDSGNARIAVDPLTAEIYVGDSLAGTGRLAMRLPLGQHTLKFRTPACVEVVQVTIVKGPPATVAHKMACMK